MIGRMAEKSSNLRKSGATLVVGVNWIGDTIMCLPALQAWRRTNPGEPLSLLVKRGLAPLWAMAGLDADVVPYDDTNRGTFAAGFALRGQGFDRAFVLPNSFRSAWMPFLGGVRERIGSRGHNRSWLLTRVIDLAATPGQEHQTFEYYKILETERASGPLRAPRLEIPASSAAVAKTLLGSVRRPVLALVPGAARGPSKQWPAAHFARAARLLAERRGFGTVILGGPSEKELCETVRAGIGGDAVNLAGATDLAGFAAVLAAADLVLCNDSGGMHVAAAAGTPLVAVYGLTDPSRTGPLGERCALIRGAGAEHASRDIARDSAEARAALESINPERVCEAALALKPKS